MKESELYELADESRTFNSVSKLRESIENLFGDKFILPVVISPDIISSNPKSLLNIKKLIPHSNTSKLTIQNYLESLRVLEDFEFKNKDYAPCFFNGEIFYGSLSFVHYSNSDSVVFTASVSEVIIPRHSFDLSCYFFNDNKNNLCYEAVSTLIPNKLEQLCQRFVGPNIKYEKRLT